ncbi:asparagine synthase (glutamine-hydrolyzing) [Streptomyces sp. SP18BB07]|uniref:asparagine synthase (glutamine-hydrolyzing) n=1 Tax=Streptomyces sp. SP18BB07 TaxID=3002522 RepID=UPI002E7AA7E5|nr:asparagine synthase (glutamine-hydrolyzing) [Streptomyces sp. SP18BB07]MEE1763530.1 asparagine synthase (glutamine-hydrolyzing) [Streptomyces sp. SP18BB07]
MCGITGWVAFDRDLRDEQYTVDAMTETMACRGPDGVGTHLAEHVALGHRRLAIIDLPGGGQPMSVPTPNGAVSLVYSGETYNFPELRGELAARGHSFTTHSDTEVVLRGYLEWGEAVAERLNGMYAFALWDARESKLVMIRDRAGIKPFYYYPTPGGVLFGSEPKAILANPIAAPIVTVDGFRELFAFIKTPGHAVWEGMREVEPGTLVTVSPTGIRTTRYWSLETREHTDDRATSVARVRELLHDTMRRQLVSDVPSCTLLSGGLDSSAMTAIAAAQLAGQGEQLRSFAVDFVGLTENFVADELRPDPDTPFVHDVAKKSGTLHQDIVLGTADMTDPDVRRKVIRARDLPSGLGDLDASLYLLFKAIREHATMALSGESADELFGGYRQFFAPEAREGTTFPWLAGHQQFFGQGRKGRQGDSPEQGRQGLLTDQLSRALDLDHYIRDSYHEAVAGIQRLDGESELEWRMRKISHLHLTRFVRIWLDRKDRMSMASGLEVRVPFSDHRLVEYVYNTPWALKSFDGKEKSLLRAAAADVLPRSVVERRKAPYPSTQDPTYAAALREQCKDLLATPGHPVFDLIDPTRLRQAVASDAPLTDQASRRDLERALDLAVWIDLYAPTIKLP